MSEEIEITGKLSEDKKSALFDFPEVMPRVLRKFGNDKKLIIKLKIFRKNRSDRQNRYLHGVVCPVIASWHLETHGERLSFDQVKAFIYQKILGYEVKFEEVLGHEQIRMEGKHFSQMNTVEFMEGVEKVQKYFAEMGCVIPDPNQENFITDFIHVS